MPANRTEYARNAGGDGLIFDWRKPRTPQFAKMGMLVVATALFFLPLTLVRLSVGAPPLQESKSASVMFFAPGNTPAGWLEKAHQLGPFPTRFDPVEWGPARDLLGEALATANSGVNDHGLPDFLELPMDVELPMVPLVTKGSRVLPRVAAPLFEPMAKVEVRTVPVFYPLSITRDELPQTSPPFAAEVTSQMASQAWRFLLQVAPDGKVRHAVAMLGQNAPGRAELVDWIQAHRFPKHDEAGDRWIAVAVIFQNQPADGPDDP